MDVHTDIHGTHPITSSLTSLDGLHRGDTIVEARRTKHLRFNDFRDPETIPVDTDYSSVIASNIPFVVQYTRLYSRLPNMALLSTVAYSTEA